MQNDDLIWLLNWFSQQCNGDWEHIYGIQIGTLDNPGWHLTVKITDTDCEGKEFKKIVVERSENDWFHCFIRDGKFEGPCGLFNLPEVLKIFRNWVEGLHQSCQNNDRCYPCACCGFLTMSEKESGSFEICPVCFWEDDEVQYKDIDYEGGANKESLREARENFKKFKVSSLRFLNQVRPPLPDEIP